jgi:hypothetical protein
VSAVGTGVVRPILPVVRGASSRLEAICRRELRELDAFTAISWRTAFIARVTFEEWTALKL